jgi:predicted DNA-binding helix-hairpin-helix protein
MRVATRVSVNLEAPTPASLAKIAPGKDFHEDLLCRMGWVRSILDEGTTPCVDHTTQFVVGAANETDTEILSVTERLYGKMKLKRAYYSAFQPVEEELHDGRRPTPTLREHRLYQADFLMRRYGFRFDELCFDTGGNLPFETDPKRAWASKHPERFPVEINRASRRELMRVPGIGPRSARRIVTRRVNEKYHSLEELKGAGTVVGWAAPYILINGKRAQELTEPGQLQLWQEG